MYILGITGGFKLGYQDAAAVLMYNGKVIAAIEEERIIRIKHAPSVMPFYAIKEVLKIAGISIEKVSEVATHGITWGEEYKKDLKQFFITYFGYCPNLSFWHHHKAHAAGAFYSSGFKKSMIITLDNSGDGISTQLAIAQKDLIEILEQYERPQSLGIFYSALTQFCGFKKDNDEYKLMGLSAFSNGGTINLDDFLNIDFSGRYIVNESYLVSFQKGMPQPSHQQLLYSNKIEQLVGIKPRIPNSPFLENYIQLASATQAKFEEVILSLIKYFYEKTKFDALCLAGGSALNCVANGKIQELNFIKNLFIQPAANDAGIAMGCAQLASSKNGIRPQKVATPYLGRTFDNDAILNALELTAVNFKKSDNPIKEAVEFLMQDKVIGWFQGSAEFGPRALGNRSILASATSKGMIKKINEKIKFRENFRPFCPSVLEEDYSLFFNLKAPSPYMTIACQAKPLASVKIPAAIHIDGTSRVQTVSRLQNELFFNLLTEYKKNSGVGVLLNTSFNRENEPIVDSPIDAISTFYGSGLDALFLGNYIVFK